MYPENWVNMYSTNCYAYALGLDIRQSDGESTPPRSSAFFSCHNPTALHLLRIRRALALCKSSITALILSAALTSAVSRYLGSAMLSGTCAF